MTRFNVDSKKVCIQLKSICLKEKQPKQHACLLLCSKVKQVRVHVDVGRLSYRTAIQQLIADQVEINHTMELVVREHQRPEIKLWEKRHFPFRNKQLGSAKIDLSTGCYEGSLELFSDNGVMVAVLDLKIVVATKDLKIKDELE
jgi:hypothetical protein